MADPFDSAHSLEQSHIQEGERDGRRDGLRAGLIEGRTLGLQKGFEIGLEVGHYAGCVRMWRALQQREPGRIPERQQHNIAAMEQMLLQYPLHNPQDELIDELMEQLRGKYKTVAAALGMGPGAAAAAAAGGGSDMQQQQSLSF